jgi:hypothetical protein
MKRRAFLAMLGLAPAVSTATAKTAKIQVPEMAPELPLDFENGVLMIKRAMHHKIAVGKISNGGGSAVLNLQTATLEIYD